MLQKNMFSSSFFFFWFGSVRVIEIKEWAISSFDFEESLSRIEIKRYDLGTTFNSYRNSFVFPVHSNLFSYCGTIRLGSIKTLMIQSKPSWSGKSTLINGWRHLHIPIYVYVDINSGDVCKRTHTHISNGIMLMLTILLLSTHRKSHRTDIIPELWPQCWSY